MTFNDWWKTESQKPEYAELIKASKTFGLDDEQATELIGQQGFINFVLAIAKVRSSK